MKILKGISLFFLYPMATFLLGVWIGVQTEHYYYPGTIWMPEPQLEVAQAVEAAENVEKNAAGESDGPAGQTVEQRTVEETLTSDPAQTSFPVSTREETLSADTEYVLWETDILHGTEVETVWELPKQFIGMDRDGFVASVQNYSDYPPLSEQERGFVNAEVVSFARTRVVVRKNYQQVRPDEVFFLAVKDNEIVVYLEDKKTVYMNTGIALETLPEDVQRQIIQTLRVEGEESLYGFLENYSS